MIIKTKKQLISFFWIIFPSLFPAIVCNNFSFAQENDVKILQSGLDGIVIEYHPIYSPPMKVASIGNEFVRYDFTRSIIKEQQLPGSPEIRIRSLLIRFPGVKNNSVEILNADYEEIPNILLSPVPNFQSGEVDPVPVYFSNPDAYRISEYVPEEVGSLENVGEVRGGFFGDLRISPLQYNAAQRLLKKYNRLVVRVNFGPAEEPMKRIEVQRGIALNDKAFGAYQPAVLSMRKASLQNSVLSSGSWYRFSISEDGMYRLTGQMMLDAGIPSFVNPGKIKIYGNGGIETPTDTNYTDDLLENAIYLYNDVNPNQLDPSDYIIFYGKSTRGWNYRPASKTFEHYEHYINHYADENIYWLTYNDNPAKQMTEISSQNVPAPYRPSTVTGKLFREDDKNNVFSSGIEWLGESFNAGSAIVYRHPLPGIDITQLMTYRFFLGSRSSNFSQFFIEEHNSQIKTVDISGSGEDIYLVGSEIPTMPNFSDGESLLRLRYTVSGTSGTGYLDWYEIFYWRFLRAQNDVFNFHTPDTTAVVEYSISGFSGGQVFVFDVTNFDNVSRITNLNISADVCTFQLEQNAGSMRELFVVGQGGFKTPSPLLPAGNQNLHGETDEAQYIIITHPDFISAAQRLKAYRERPGNNYLKTKVVDVNQIYNEFSGGLLSPVAIRNYLRYVYFNWSNTLKYVLLFGDGDYDYKRILGGTNPNWVPPWESKQPYQYWWQAISTYASDDYFGIFTGGNLVNFGIGRLTAQTLQEANTMVDKIIEYETHSVPDPWKLRFTFVADDGPQAADASSDGFLHTGQADSIANLVPQLFEKKKIYLYEYPTTFTSSGRKKPDVNIAIDNSINQGTLILNFTGHGNPRLWTHEAVFVRETDFPLLHNKGKYFFLVAATCNYSNFDQLTEKSSGELLVLMQDAGAIAVFSATRPVYAHPNFEINVEVYKNMLNTTRFGNILTQRLGDIIWKAKQERAGENDRKFFLLGDPALQLSFPKMIASIDSINHRSSDENIQLKALERTSIYAAVHDLETDSSSNFNGRAQVVVYDANRRVRLIAPELGGRESTYTASGSVIFRGQNSVNNGVVNSNFIVPKDISYSDAPGRITMYFSNDSTDGAGYTGVLINGTSNDTTDKIGPLIRLYIDNRSFRPGDVVSASPILIADFFDSSGINISDAGIGHRLEAWLDDKSVSINLSDAYKSKEDTYMEGSIENYPLGKLSQGTHMLRVRAWDAYNNSSTEETVFNVVSGDGLKISEVYNYPNPFSPSSSAFSSATEFTFKHNQVIGVDAEVKIYTVAGRLIQTIKQSGIVNQFVRIPWNGRDKDGDLLANGVYLYKVIAKTQDGRFSSESLGKISIIK